MKSENNELSIQQAGDYIRYLSVLGVEMAKSGHPGLPLGCADIGVILYRDILKYLPEEPLWLNRDRFVLSAGHGSMFLYSLLYCAGYPFKIEDLAKFRSLNSKTPGHPEREAEWGIETTTGPLGQGFANAVGMALEEKMLEARFNKKETLFDYSVYTIMGDGCNMEGISYEAASIAGHLKLDNLIAIYDSNRITIDGSTEVTFTEDVAKRYEAQGWHVQSCGSDDLSCLKENIVALKNRKGKPKLLIVKTTIGKGLNKLQGTNKVHGSPAGADEITYLIQNSTIRDIFGEKFGKDVANDTVKLKEIVVKSIADRIYPVVSEERAGVIRSNHDANKKTYLAWKEKLEKVKKADPEGFELLSKMLDGKLPSTLQEKLLNYREEKSDATRNVSGRVLSICAQEMPQIVGGCADLVESTKTVIKDSPMITPADFSGRNIAFGIREHGMGSVVNGLALNNIFLPFSSTFFVFSDYMRPSIRLAAIMKLRHLFVYTHDSIYVGEDGPTHQPIEQLNSLRLMPGLTILRPSGAMETAFSYLYYLEKNNGPVVILGTRQNLAATTDSLTDNRSKLYEDFKNGALLVHETEKNAVPDLTIAASGSEVELAVAAGKLLETRDEKKVRVLSIPSLELWSASGENFRNKMTGNPKDKFVFIEACSHRAIKAFYGEHNAVIDIERFGTSAPASKAAEELGMTPESVYQKIKSL